MIFPRGTSKSTSNKAILLSSHNPNHALAINATVALIYENMLEAWGPAGSTLSNTTLKKVYGDGIQLIEEPLRKYCVFDV